MSELWCVNITGVDDVIPVATRAEAIDLSARFNNWWMRRFPPAELHDFDPTTWAVPIPWMYSAAAHARQVSSLGEYEWLRNEPSGVPTTQPTESQFQQGDGE